jgi:hypothetical protein
MTDREMVTQDIILEGHVPLAEAVLKLHEKAFGTRTRCWTACLGQQSLVSEDEEAAWFAKCLDEARQTEAIQKTLCNALVSGMLELTVRFPNGERCAIAALYARSHLQPHTRAFSNQPFRPDSRSPLWGYRGRTLQVEKHRCNQHAGTLVKQVKKSYQQATEQRRSIVPLYPEGVELKPDAYRDLTQLSPTAKAELKRVLDDIGARRMAEDGHFSHEDVEQVLRDILPHATHRRTFARTYRIGHPAYPGRGRPKI